MNKLSPEIVQQSVDALAAHGGNLTQAAKYLRISRSTMQHRIDLAERTALQAGQSDSGPQPLVTESIELRDQIRSLQAQIAAHRRETLDDKYVREKILGLAAQPLDPPAWLIRERAAKGLPGVPTLFASDWHWGEVVNPHEINGVNEFNLGIAHARARQMVESAIDLLNCHMVNPKYPGIVFALGGDMVTGDIHEELSATNEAEIMPTVVDIIGVLIWCIDRLAGAFGHVFIPCVTGNHGRNTKKMRAKGRNFTNFDWLIYSILARHFESDARVQFLIPDGSDALYQIYGHRYLLTHGDQFRGGDALIGALGPIVRGDHRKRSRNGQIGMHYDTIVMGHWHQLMQTQKFIVNGSLKGYDEYAYSNNYPFEEPRQALWITHPDRGITFHMPVQVEKPRGGSDRSWVKWAA